MPSLSVRSFAELLHLPAYEQERILYEQKYPAREPQKFKVPYYLHALKGIRDYYAAANDPRALATARARVNALNAQARRRQNIRVLNGFQRSREARRRLVPSPLSRLAADPHPGVELRLMFDIEAAEHSNQRRIFYNLRNAPIEGEVATSALQYIDLKNGRVYVISRQSQRTLRQMRANARIIATLWPTI